MFHILEKLCIGMFFPLICILTEYNIKKNKNSKVSFKNISLKWFVLWNMGIGAFLVGLMQAFNPSYTAHLLQLQTNDYIAIKELGYCQLGISVLGFLSYKNKEYRKACSIAYGLFILGCTLNHFTRVNIITADEAATTIADIWIVLTALLELLFDNDDIDKGKVWTKK